MFFYFQGNCLLYWSKKYLAEPLLLKIQPQLNTILFLYSLLIFSNNFYVIQNWINSQNDKIIYMRVFIKLYIYSRE